MVAAMRSALDALAGRGVGIVRVSAPFVTAPQGDQDQPEFVNAAGEVVFPGSPAELLDIVLAVESELGRVRTARRFGPRPIDIDILAWSGGAWRDERLEVPHPRLHERRFALVPLVEIAAGLRLPDGSRIDDALKRLEDEPDQSVEPLSGVVVWPPPD